MAGRGITGVSLHDAVSDCCSRRRVYDGLSCRSVINLQRQARIRDRQQARPCLPLCYTTQ